MASYAAEQPPAVSETEAAAGHLPHIDLWRRRLTLPTYTSAETARYAKTHAQTVGYWFRGGATVGPTLPRRKPGERLNYLEAVEVAFVAAFRRFGVRLRNLRDAHAYFQAVLKTEYPFAVERFRTEGTHVLKAWDDSQETWDFTKVLVGDEHGQLAWAELLSEKFHEFDYENDIAVRWHVAGRSSPIQIDPRVSFGAPSVRGIPTWALRGRREAGESKQEIGEVFGLDDAEVHAGLAFEGLELAVA